jgi:hypothetical protein
VVARHEGRGRRTHEIHDPGLRERGRLQRRTDEKKKDVYWGAYRAYTKALADAGVMVGGAGLQPPPLATTIRLTDGRRQVQDGPFAEAKEQLGGYYVIEVPDLDRALDWAARCPAASAGGVEVRPNLSA